MNEARRFPVVVRRRSALWVGLVLLGAGLAAAQAPAARTEPAKSEGTAAADAPGSPAPGSVESSAGSGTVPGTGPAAPQTTGVERPGVATERALAAPAAKPALLEPLPLDAPPGWDAADAEGPAESAAGMLLRTVLVLGAVLAAVYLTLNVGLRRLMGMGTTGGRASGLLSVVERHAVGPRQAILVVRAGREYLIVGQTETGMSLLSKLEPAEVEARELAAAAAPGLPALSPFLQKLLSRKDGAGQPPPPSA